MSGLEIRLLAPTDASALAVFFEVLKEKGLDSHFHPHPFSAEEAEKRASYTGMDLYYIITAEGGVLGYGMLRGWDEGYAIPSLGIAVHPEVRGSGMSRMFMHFLQAAAKQRGAKRMRLTVEPENTPAVRLYCSLGYKFEDENAHPLMGFLDL